MGVLRVNQNPYDEFISSGSTTKKGQEREGSRERAKRKGKEKGGVRERKRREYGLGAGEGARVSFQRCLFPGSDIVAVQRNL